MTHSTRNLVLVVLVIAACGIALFSMKKKDAVLQENTPVSPVVSEESKTIKDATDFYTISARYPVEPRDTQNVMEEYVTYVVNQKKEEWKTGGEVYKEEQKIAKDFPDRPTMTYELAIDYKTYRSPKMNTVSYVFNAYQFTGGAHGGTNIATFTFGANGRIKIEDILNFNDNNNDIALTRLLAAKLPGILGDSAIDEMIHNGLGLAYLKADGKTFDPKKCGCDGFFFPSNMQNFIVSDEGITFIMNQYQVAPYAVGMPEVLLLWRELAPFINRDFGVPLD